MNRVEKIARVLAKSRGMDFSDEDWRKLCAAYEVVKNALPNGRFSPLSFFDAWRDAAAVVDAEASGDPTRREFSSVEPGLAVRHVKRGSEYVVVGMARLQCSRPLPDMEEVVVYESLSDGGRWARDASEFLDGRFVRAGDGSAIVSSRPLY